MHYNLLQALHNSPWLIHRHILEIKNVIFIGMLRHAFSLGIAVSVPSSLLEDVSRERCHRLNDKNPPLITWNLFRIWSEALIGWRSNCVLFSYCLRMTNKKVANVNVNTLNLPQNSHCKWNIFFFKRSMWVLMLIVRSRHSSKLYLQYNAFYCFAFLLIQELGFALGCPIEK